MESGSISKWHIKEGEKFQPGQAMCEVETDKATVTYEATDEGFLV
jgi:pyruvate dehydrogenase E2 component (dihydrolipoamide acetyltransferase)